MAAWTRPSQRTASLSFPAALDRALRWRFSRMARLSPEPALVSVPLRHHRPYRLIVWWQRTSHFQVQRLAGNRLQPDDRILAAVQSIVGRGSQVARLLSNGNTDTRFGMNGFATPTGGAGRSKFLGNGDILVFGGLISRLTLPGAGDTTFGVNGLKPVARHGRRRRVRRHCDHVVWQQCRYHGFRRRHPVRRQDRCGGKWLRRPRFTGSSTHLSSWRYLGK